MSKIRLFGDSSGFTEIAAADAAGNNTLTLPNDGTIISKDSAGAIGITSVRATNAHFSGTTRVTTGITTTATITTGTITTGTITTAKVTTIQDASGSNGSTPEQVFQGRAKAWVNFNGEGTIAIRDSFNVSSITDEAVGVYTVNIDTDMANVNYCAVVTTGYSSNDIQTSQNSQLFQHSTKTVGSFKIRQGNSENNSNDDADDVNAVVFGD